MTTITGAVKRSLDTEADESRVLDRTRIDFLSLGGFQFARAVFQPGWRWSTCVKPVAQTDSCEFPHAMYIAQGTLHVRMDDGTELDLAPGDVTVIAPGHDAWVTSDVDFVCYDVSDLDTEYGTPPNS
jgi:hypothetical protein